MPRRMPRGRTDTRPRAGEPGGFSRGSKRVDESCPIGTCNGGDINIKHPYKRVHCTENIISQGTRVTVRLPRGLLQPSIVVGAGRGRGHRRRPGAAIPEGHHPTAVPSAPGAGSGTPRGLVSCPDGFGLHLAWREVHRCDGGWGPAPSSRQQPQAGHLGREEGVDDEDDGFGAGVEVQLLQGRSRETFAIRRAVQQTAGGCHARGGHPAAPPGSEGARGKRGRCQLTISPSGPPKSK